MMSVPLLCLDSCGTSVWFVHYHASLYVFVQLTRTG